MRLNNKLTEVSLPCHYRAAGRAPTSTRGGPPPYRLYNAVPAWSSLHGHQHSLYHTDILVDWKQLSVINRLRQIPMANISNLCYKYNSNVLQTERNYWRSQCDLCSMVLATVYTVYTMIIAYLHFTFLFLIICIYKPLWLSIFGIGGFAIVAIFTIKKMRAAPLSQPDNQTESLFHFLLHYLFTLNCWKKQ